MKRLLLIVIPLFLILGCDDVIQPDAIIVYVDPSLSPSDITTAIQEAIDNSITLNKRLVLEQATYIINSTIWIPSDADIDFGGSIIKRESGMQVELLGAIFDMIVSSDTLSGNVNITLQNLTIDGNTLGNGTPVNDAHRFSGLKLSKVRDSRLENITVINTINAEHRYNIQGEHPAGGIFFSKNCKNINCYGLNAYNNNLSGIIIRESQKIKIDGSITSNNLGSGITSVDSDSCEFYNIISFDNGFQNFLHNSDGTLKRYSNISINGENCIVNNVTTYNCSSGSGLIIGHNGATSNADYTKVDSVDSSYNGSDGITVRNSTGVKLSRIYLHHNKGHNLHLDGTASYAQINKAKLYGYYDMLGVNEGGYGLRIEDEGGHIIDSSEIYDNFHNGIGIINVGSSSGTADSIVIGSGVKIYDNGRTDEFSQPSHKSSGIRLDQSHNVDINCPKIYCTEDSVDKSQDYGIHILSGGNHTIEAEFDPNNANALQKIKSDNNPQYVDIDTTTCNLR